MNSATVERSTAASRLRYRTIDLVTMAALGLAFGVVFWAWGKLYGVLNLAATVGFPPTVGIFLGGWLIAGVVGGLIIAKPGAAFGTEVIAAVVSMFVLGGTEWGFSVLLSGLVQGIGAELGFAAGRYRSLGVRTAILAGVLAAVCASVYEWILYYADWSWGYKLVLLGFSTVSGALIAGVLGWVLVRALAKTGALDSFAAGRKAADEIAAT